MTVTINGTTGIAGTNGSAGTPAVQGEDTNTGIFFPAADTVAVATGGSERLRVDSSGNAGLGVTPAAWSSPFGAFQFGPNGGSINARTDSNQAVEFALNWYYDGSTSRYVNTNFASRYRQYEGQHQWYTAPSGTAGNAITFTQAMTLDASGNLLVGTTSAGANGFSIVKDAIYGGWYSDANHPTGVPNSYPYAWFRYNGTLIGSIVQSGTTGVAYNTSSDYRLKENVAPMQNALDTVAQLNPVTYTWKADGSAGQGFIAHELQAVVPDCVTGEKDAVDETGNPQYQGVDTSFLVATLVAAIKELKAEVDSLKAQLEAK